MSMAVLVVACRGWASGLMAAVVVFIVVLVLGFPLARSGCSGYGCGAGCGPAVVNAFNFEGPGSQHSPRALPTPAIATARRDSASLKSGTWKMCF